MKKYVIGLLAMLMATGFSAPSHAYDSGFGIRAGQLTVDGDSGSAIQAGLVFSTNLVGMLGLEFEANTTVADGEYQFGAAEFDYSATQLGAYAVLRSPGSVYFKGKAGYVQNDIDFGFASDKDDDVAYGLGIGFSGLEIEYTRSTYFDNDVDFMSLTFQF
jgi:hypothetical protein